MTTSTTPAEEPAALEIPDGTLYPLVEDFDGVWHRRPPGDEWTISDAGPNARTVCGQEVPSVHAASEGAGAATCPACVNAAGPLKETP